MVRNQWALAVTGLGSCLIIAAACAGGDTPPRDAELEEKIRSTFDPDYPPVGAAGSVSMSGMGGGSGAGGGSAAGAGGGSSGTGGGAASGGSGSGSAGSGSVGSSGSGATGPVCDAPTQVFGVNCTFQPCHGDGSNNGSFADSEAAAKALLDKPTKNTGCGKYIDSANPDDSALLTKLGANPPCGTQMPFNADPLLQKDIDCVKSWLSQF